MTCFPLGDCLTSFFFNVGIVTCGFGVILNVILALSWVFRIFRAKSVTPPK